MRTYKKLLLAVVGPLTLLLLTAGLACSDSSSRAPFVGKWAGPALGMQTQFFADGTCIQNSTSGTYQIVEQGAVKYLKLDFKIVATMYEIVSISPNFIKLKEGDNDARQLQRLAP